MIAVSSTAVDGELPKGSLLEGIYNEEESSKSFQEALQAWRSSQHPVNKQEGMTMDAMTILLSL